MKVISSQRYYNNEIVLKKMDELKEACANEIVLPVVDIEMKDEDGNDLFALVDGHHRFIAAQELDLEIKFEVVENHYDVVGEDYLNAAYMDSDWYYVETGLNVWQ